MPKCERCGADVSKHHQFYCLKCGKNNGIWALDFDQGRDHPTLLKKLGPGGVCHGFVMLWIEAGLNKGIFDPVNLSKKQALQIQLFMEEEADELKKLDLHYIYDNDGPISDLKGQFWRFAQKNNGLAVYAKHKLLESWLRSWDACCITRLTFDDTTEMISRTKQLGSQYGCVIGYLSLQGNKGAHSLGFAYSPKDDTGFEVTFFDPNYGIYCFRKAEDFVSAELSNAWLNKFIKKHYPTLTELIYVNLIVSNIKSITSN